MNMGDSPTGPVFCVGLDPSREVLRSWALPDSIEGLQQFVAFCCLRIPEVTSVAKPQIAYYERFGSAGLRALEDLVQSLRAQNVNVIIDAKRGDIGATNEAYATAFLASGAPLECDGLTLSPFLGVTDLKPFADLAARHEKFLFIVLKASNPSAVMVRNWGSQDAPLWRGLQTEIMKLPRQAGWVVGASDADLGELATINRPLLIPGVGAQGGKLEEVLAVLGGQPGVISLSRTVIGHGADSMLRRAAELRAVIEG